MFIKNDTIYTLAAGNCGGVGVKPDDIKSLAQMGDITTGLGDEMLVGEEEVIEEITWPDTYANAMTVSSFK